MAKVKGNQGIVQIGGNTVASVKRFTLDEDIEIFEDTDLDETEKNFQTEDSSWSGEIECAWDKADTTGQEAMTIGAQVSLSLQPEGDTTGDETYSGTAIITKRSTMNEKQSMVMRTFSFQGTGTLTQGNV